MIGRLAPSRRSPLRLAPQVYALCLTLAVTAPLLSPGYLLIRDAVSTPRSYLSDAALGAGDAAPRALPQDFLIAVTSTVLDGGVIVKALLFAGIFLAGWGAARLVGHVVSEAGLSGQLVAVTVAVWNPYIAERLLQGHWSLLVGYGCLPWVALAVIRLRTQIRGAETAGSRWSDWTALVFWMAVAGLTPTGLMLAATVALVCITTPGEGACRLRCLGGVGGAAVVIGLPWLTATALLSTLGTPQSGVAAFAARAEPGLGTLGTLAGLGGIWNAEAVPSSRTSLLALAATAVLVGVVAVGVPMVVRRPGAFPLLILAAVSIAVPAVMATGPGLNAVDAVLDAVPGLGVVRDGQKWVALAIPGYAVAAAGAVLTARRWVPRQMAAGVCAIALVAVLPDLAWGAGGKVISVHYPAGWAHAAETLNADPGTVAVLPPDSMRMFAWSGSAPVLDPLPRWVRADVLTTGDLQISGATVLGEGAKARHVQQALLDGVAPDELAKTGVRWVVVERGSPGGIGRAEETLARLDIAYQDNDIALYRVDGDISRTTTTNHRTVLITAHLLWLVTLAASGIALAVSRFSSGAGRSSSGTRQ